MSRHRVRIRFRKQGDLRLVSHRDLVRALERLFRRMGLALGMTEGFHPRPRISFPSALALGICGWDEVLELELTAEPDPEQLLADLSANAPPGLEFTAVERLPAGAPKLHVESATYEIEVPVRWRERLDDKIAALLALASYPIERPARGAPIDLRANLAALSLADGTLAMRLAARNEASARPHEVLEALGLGDLLVDGGYLTRTEVACTAASAPA